MRLINADELMDKVVPKNEDAEFRCVPLRDILNAPTVHPEPQKIGKWIEVHGWATPGGDPVWACSECGKGLHVYGVEHGTYGSDVADGQWVACPNCGAQMEGADDRYD